MGVVFSNNGESLLVAGISDVVQVLSIRESDAPRFPELGAGEWFPVTVVDVSGNLEIMRCTARNGGTLAVQRGQEGTTARSFQAGARVEHRATAAALTELAQDTATPELGPLQEQINKLRSTSLIPLAEYGSVATATGYMDALLNFPKQLSAEGGGSISLPKGPTNLTGQVDGSTPMFGVYAEQSIPLFANVHLHGHRAYRRNAIVAAPSLPRATPVIRLASPAEAGWNGAYPAEVASLEANFGLVGCLIHGNERNRPALTNAERTNAAQNLAHHGYLLDLATTFTNGVQTQLWGLNDTRGVLVDNVLMGGPESGLRMSGRGESIITGNRIAFMRIFGWLLDSFDNHAGMNIINNCGHSGLIVLRGNNRFGDSKIWFIGYLPLDNRWGSRDAVFGAVAALGNPTGQTLNQSYAMQINSGAEGVLGNITVQDTYGHGVRDQGKNNKLGVAGDNVGVFYGGDQGQTRWTGDTPFRGVYVLSGENPKAEVQARQRTVERFAGSFTAFANGANYTAQSLIADPSDGTYWQGTGAFTSPASGTFADDRAANPSRYAQRFPAVSHGIWTTKLNDEPFDIEATFAETDGFMSGVGFVSSEVQKARSQGSLKLNGVQAWERRYVKPADRLSAGITQINPSAGIIQFDITSNTWVQGNLPRPQAENIKLRVQVRRTPGVTGRALIVGTFDGGGQSLNVNADYQDLELTYVVTPDEGAPSGSNGRWIVTGGANYTIVVPGGGGGGGGDPEPPPPLIDLVATYAELNGGLPSYKHPSSAYLTEAQGTFQDVSQWTKLADPGGNMVIDANGITFQSHPSQQNAQHAIPNVASGATVRLWWQNEFGGGQIKMGLGSDQVAQANNIAGWWTAKLTTTALRSTLNVRTVGGATGARVRNVAIELDQLEQYDVLLLAGQSNLAAGSSGPPDPAIDLCHPKIHMMPNTSQSGYMTTDGVIVPARVPMQMSGFITGLTPALAWAWWYAENVLAPNRKLLLVCNALGGTSLAKADSPWAKGSTNPYLYNGAVADTLTALGLNPGNNKLIGVLWCQGESDLGAGAAATYKTAYAQLVADMRADLSVPNLPFFVLGLNPYATAGGGLAGLQGEMIAAQASMDKDASGGSAIAHNYYTGWPPEWGDPSIDNTHFLAAANRVRGVVSVKDAFTRGAFPALKRIVVIANTGQSNEKGRNPGLGAGGGIVAGDIASDPRILSWGSAGPNVGALITAVEPLRHPDSVGTEPYVGPAIPFAKALLPTLGADDKIVIVPLAKGGTGYVATGEWAVGGSLYTNSVTRLNALKAFLAANYPDYAVEWCFAGIAGEDDAATRHTVYLAAVKASLEGIAAAVGMASWSLATTLMSPAWVAATAGGNAINSAKIRLREMFPRTWIMAAPDGPYDPDTTNIHFNANAQVVCGQRRASAYDNALARIAPLSPKINLCDDLSTVPFACYSTWRRLRAAYTGPAIQITRASDNTTLDVGFDADGRVDFAAIETFCAGTNGFVSIWYDQSGAGRHFGQNGATTMPQIVSNGQILWRAGKPVMGGNNGTLLANYNAGGAAGVLIAGHFVDTGTVSLISSRGLQVFRVAGTSNYACTIHNAGAIDAGVTIPAGPHVFLGIPATGTQRAFLDGAEQLTLSSIATNNASAAGITTLLGRQTNVGGAINQLAGDLISEVILGEIAWGDAGRATLHAATVEQYLTDPF